MSKAREKEERVEFKPFRQGRITAAFGLDSLGVCNGLTLEYARRWNARQERGKSVEDIDFVDKLERILKRERGGSKDDAFVTRIKNYQEIITFADSASGTAVLDEVAVDRDGLLTCLPREHVEEANTIGISFIQSGGGGHVAGIHLIRDPETKAIKGYTLFDPNFGEWKFTAGTPEENKEAFDKTFKQLADFYYARGLTTIASCDLDKLLEKRKLFVSDPAKKTQQNKNVTAGQVAKDEKAEKDFVLALRTSASAASLAVTSGLIVAGVSATLSTIVGAAMLTPLLLHQPIRNALYISLNNTYKGVKERVDETLKRREIMLPEIRRDGSLAYITVPLPGAVVDAAKSVIPPPYVRRVVPIDPKIFGR
jgi:hypothetical protein